MKGLSVLSECEGLLVRGLGVYKIGVCLYVFMRRGLIYGIMDASEHVYNLIYCVLYSFLLTEGNYMCDREMKQPHLCV